MNCKVSKTHYLIDNKRYDRITSVLDYFTPPELSDWKDKLGAKEAKQVSKTAKAIGTRVHNLILQHYQKKSYYLTENDSPSIVNCMQAYLNWHTTEQPKILQMEQTVYDDELGVAGTYDIELDIPIIDIKTSSAIRPTYWLQLAMYSYMHNKKPIGILRLDKFTADYEYKVTAFDDRLVNCFIGLLNYFRYITSYKIKDKSDKIEYNTIAESIFKPKVEDDWTEWHREV